MSCVEALLTACAVSVYVSQLAAGSAPLALIRRLSHPPVIRLRR